MRYYALATDYDGTLATDGHVDEKTIAALERLRNSGRKLILVTGREIDQLLQVFPQINLFDRVVAENGAVLYRPSTNEEKLLCESPHERFINELKRRAVMPVSVGRCIVATWKPHEKTVLEVIRDMGLELQVIFNKDAVMVLPSGINKATGLNAALKELGLSHHNIAGIGDAENDHAFLKSCEFSAAVQNALPLLKERADLVTASDHGAGVTELIDSIVKNDLEEFNGRLVRHMIPLGITEYDKEVCVKPYGSSILIAGTSGGGKTSLSTGFMESLTERKYQYCIIDPEGDYEDLESAVVQGTIKHPPIVSEIIKILEIPRQNCVVNMLGIPVEDRPVFFNELLPALLELRMRTGRPHWIIVDETHHLLPTDWDPAMLSVPRELKNMVFVTVHPDHVSKLVLSSVDMIVAMGETPAETIGIFSQTLNLPVPELPVDTPDRGDAIAWELHPDEKGPALIHVYKPKSEQLRHRRKYAEGELGNQGSFYFRGPKNKLNLRVQNLMFFLQIAEGIDDETWCFHLQRGDYSRWFRDIIKNRELAEGAESIERDSAISARESRELIRKLIEEKYTAPA